MEKIKNIEIWYWEKKDQLIRALDLGKDGWLMFFQDDMYYYYPVTKRLAKKNGVIFLGKE